MGFKFNGKNSDDFGFYFTTSAMPYIPQKKQTKAAVPGRDGEYIFEGDYENIQIELACVMGHYEISARRKMAREIAAWLSKPGTLVFDYEEDIEYQVVAITNNINASIIGREYRDEFTITFTCAPYQLQSYFNDNLTWGQIDSGWGYTELPWGGSYPRKFTVTNGSTMTLTNNGTYQALPLIKIEGVANSISFGGMNLISLNGIVYVDTVNYVVYSELNGVKTNRIGWFTGDFIKLQSGDNVFTVTGDITSATVEFIYKNTYL